MRNFTPTAMAAATLLATSAFAQSFTDNFDTGSDTAWTHSSPLQGFGVTGTFSFPGGNAYRIHTTTPSPDQGSLGPARAGAYVATLEQTDFRITVDLVDWDDLLTQDIGILARIGSPGLGTLTGYAFSYDTGAGAFFLTRIDGEKPTNLANGGFFIDPSGTYRMTFHGYGGELLAVVTDLADPEFPVAELFAFDDTYASGYPGLFNNGLGDDALTDSTFDNFRADALPDTDFDTLPDPWESRFYGNFSGQASADTDGDHQTSAQEFAAGTDPTDPSSRFAATSANIDGDAFTVTFTPALPDRIYTLELSENLSTWLASTAPSLTIKAGVGSLTIPHPLTPFSAARVTVTAPQ